MNGLKTTIYRKTEDLPPLKDANFFHSTRLFKMTRETPRQKPYMVVVTNEQGEVVSHMLGIASVRSSSPYSSTAACWAKVSITTTTSIRATSSSV